jgi:hypothetical protein
MTAASAEIVAFKALAFLANLPQAAARFEAETGADFLNSRQRAGDPEFLAAVVDFLLADEALARAFCAAESLEPAALRLARRALPGAAPEQ